MNAVAKKQPATRIAELKQKIGSEQRALDALQAQAVELRAARKTALLADGDEPLAEVEASIQSTLRQAERHRARLDAFHADLEVAEEEQRQEEARQAYEAAARQIAEAERWLMTNYPKLAQQLADGLARIKAADQLAESVNRELPANCEPLRPPSNARHESATNDRVETRDLLKWVDRDGHPYGSIQFREGKPPAGARQVLVQEEVRIPGRRGWFPRPVYAEVSLPALEKDQADFWRP